MVSLVVLTAAPAEVAPLPVLASALIAALRAELLLAAAAASLVVVLAAFANGEGGAVTVPAGAFDTAVPGGTAPDVAT
jgi:hypothetical protein